MRNLTLSGSSADLLIGSRIDLQKNMVGLPCFALVEMLKVALEILDD